MSRLKMVREKGRLSHLEYEEVSDVARLFEDTKRKYSISHREVARDSADCDDNANDDGGYGHMIGNDTLRRYKLREQEAKMLKRAARPHRPKFRLHKQSVEMRKTLNQFLKRNQDRAVISHKPYEGAMKESSQALKYVRLNPRNKSAMGGSSYDGFNRDIIISMETSRPAAPYIHPPSLREAIEKGLVQTKSRAKEVNLVEALEREFDRLIPGGHVQRDSLQEHKAGRRPVSVMEVANSLINSSVAMSKGIIQNMDHFYQVRRHKNGEMEKMVETIRRDLPMTREIRTRYYTPSHISSRPIQQLRKTSEAERRQKYSRRTSDEKVYLGLVDFLAPKSYSGQSLPFTEAVLDSLKTRLEDCLPISVAAVEEKAASLRREGVWEDRLFPKVLQFLNNQQK